MELLASNVFYPVSFTKVELTTTKVTLIDINQVTSTSATVRVQYNIVDMVDSYVILDDTGE